MKFLKSYLVDLKSGYPGEVHFWAGRERIGKMVILTNIFVRENGIAC